MQKLKQAAESVGPRHQRLVGRGSSALWVALQAIAARDGFKGEAIMPDMICSAVLETVLAAGYVPRLADINPGTYSITAETIKPLLNPETHVIIVAHLFGHAAPIHEIGEIAHQHGARLVEDAVQGIGGYTVRQTAIGSHGDFAFVSFDESKMIGGRGGLLLYDDETWTSFTDAAIDMLPSRSVTAADHLPNTSLRDLYHGLGQGVRLGILDVEAAATMFRAALPIYAPFLLRQFNDSPANWARILRGWEDLPSRVRQRNANAAALREALEGLPIEQPPYRPGDAIWRYSVLFPTGESADRFVVSLRERGGLVSHLYYPLHQLYEPKPGFRSADIARRVVNLWVDDRVDSHYMALVGDVASQVLAPVH